MFYRQHARTITPTGEHSMTKQSHKNECDINLILKQYQKTGQITHITKQTPLYTDLPDHIDYQSSLNTLQTAQEAFSSLPSRVRERFNHDPAQFLQAFGDPEQRAYLIEMGLIRPPAPSGATTPTEGQGSPPA